VDAADPSVWFVGDLDDPWVASIAEALPAGSRRIACNHDLPDDWPAASSRVLGAPRVIVLHRALLGPCDADRLARLRTVVMPSPRVILCVGPHARHFELERWMARGLIDAVIPEAIARETLARHLESAGSASRRPIGPRPRVAVVSGNWELRRTLTDTLESLGYPASSARDWSEAEPTGPALWDVPLLEPDWTRALARRSERGPVVVLLGFADRALVGQARARGAAACLELPYDRLDLGHVLDRVTAARVEPAHAFPPSPASRHRPSNVALVRTRARPGELPRHPGSKR
jgi:CheY-like chemotaxis protein